MIRVIFYEVFQEEEAALKKYLSPEIDPVFFSQTIQEEGHEKTLADIISIRTQSEIPNVWVEHLKAILTRSQGYDHLTKFLKTTTKDIPCGFLKNYCAIAVAEHAIMSAMVLLKQLKKQIQAFDSFQRSGIMGLEIRGKNCFILGVGCIGLEILNLARGMKMNTKGFDLEQRKADLEYVNLAEGIAWADIIICALPLTTETKNILNYKTLSIAKPGTIFINISRGEISPITDLKLLLDGGIFGGIALDVYEDESDVAEHLRTKKEKTSVSVATALELKDQNNVLFTPHNAFNTTESLEQKSQQSIGAIEYFLKNGKFPNTVPRD